MTTELPVTLLVVAKAPVPGLAKTRLMKAMTAEEAAGIAAAALLDTLAAVVSTPARRRVVAMTGELADAARSDEVREALSQFIVVDQRGDDFAKRLVNAHHDAFDGDPVVQIGMDTPQVTPTLLTSVCTALLRPPEHCVLGPALDGGWWVLGVPNPTWVTPVGSVPMSQSDTGDLTRSALDSAGGRVVLVEPLLDADELEDLQAVADLCAPNSNFARAVANQSR
ncbi:TIGR04282 family arsenosugar biosynthesis glycosyltransferase [Actinomycetes bacterium M1A6_2h]